MRELQCVFLQESNYAWFMLTNSVARNLHEGSFAAQIDLACTAGRLQYGTTLLQALLQIWSHLRISRKGTLFRCDRGCKKT